MIAAFTSTALALSRIIDIAILNDNNLRSTIEDMKEKYRELCFELTELWGMQNILVDSIALSNTGMILKYLLHRLTTIGLSEGLFNDAEISHTKYSEYYAEMFS